MLPDLEKMLAVLSVPLERDGMMAKHAMSKRSYDLQPCQNRGDLSRLQSTV